MAYDDDASAARDATGKAAKWDNCMPGPYRRLVIILVRPSKYDDEGYVVRHWRGTIPSNTLSCLTSLTEDVIASGDLGLEVHLERIDETVARVDPLALGRRYRRDGNKVVVG